MLNVKKHGEPRYTLSVALREDQYGVHLIAVDDTGKPLPNGWLVSLSNDDAKLHLHRNINPDLGLDLDEQGVVRTEVR